MLQAVQINGLVWTDSYLVLDLARLESETAVHLLRAVQVNGLVWTDSYLVFDLARLEGETAVHLLQAVQINGALQLLRCTICRINLFMKNKLRIWYPVPY